MNSVCNNKGYIYIIFKKTDFFDELHIFSNSYKLKLTISTRL